MKCRINMNRFLLVLAIPAMLYSCVERRKDKVADDTARQYEQFLKDTTSVQIIDSAYNFGKVTDGEKVEYSYRFRNTGTKPLMITSATASCGCTVPQKPEKPIFPGETGFIKIVFDSKGRVGNAHKTITVLSNASPAFPELQLTGEVQAKKDN
ncbi:MAG: DUF1573 domain-containing protein [Chitinophagaceae bacterium]|nr:DUF1573 domain-containing protein [Chitinophagaceae bacterium]